MIETDESIYPISDFISRDYYVSELSSAKTMMLQLPQEESQNVFFQLDLIASRELVVSDRIYLKIQTAISLLGGFLKVLHIFFFLIFSTYNSFDLWLKVVCRQSFDVHSYRSNSS